MNVIRRSLSTRRCFAGGTVLALLAAFATVSVGSTAQAAAEVPKVRKLAMVDMQKVLNDTKSGQAARKKLDSSSKAKQAKFDKKRAQLETDAAKLETMSGAALAKAQEKLQQESMELQSMLMTLEQELAQQQSTVLEEVYKNSQEIVADIAKEQSIDLVLVRDPMTVIFAKDGLDITGEVVKRYDKKHK